MTDETQGPPEDYEPQVPLEPDQATSMQEREDDLIASAEAEMPDVKDDRDGDADAGDDDVEDNEPE
jgi:hypothetical protein